MLFFPEFVLHIHLVCLFMLYYNCPVKFYLFILSPSWIASIIYIRVLYTNYAVDASLDFPDKK